jgi:hypothetical protein
MGSPKASIMSEGKYRLASRFATRGGLATRDVDSDAGHFSPHLTALVLARTSTVTPRSQTELRHDPLLRRLVIAKSCESPPKRNIVLRGLIVRLMIQPGSFKAEASILIDFKLRPFNWYTDIQGVHPRTVHCILVERRQSDDKIICACT